MKRKIIAFLTLILFIFNTLYAQDSFYLDKNIVKIDSVEVNKVLYNFKFGKLSPIEYEQIKKALIQKSKKHIDDDAVLLVNYRDSLFDFEIRKKKYNIHIQEHKGINHQKFTLETFDKSRKKWISRFLSSPNFRPTRRKPT